MLTLIFSDVKCIHPIVLYCTVLYCVLLSCALLFFTPFLLSSLLFSLVSLYSSLLFLSPLIYSLVSSLLSSSSPLFFPNLTYSTFDIKGLPIVNKDGSILISHCFAPSVTLVQFLSQQLLLSRLHRADEQLLS